MSREKAVLILDPERRDEQRAFIDERAEDIIEMGDALWASITESQAESFAERGITVQRKDQAAVIDLPAVSFDPADGEPLVPTGLSAAAPTGDQTAYYLVQFAAPPLEEWAMAVEELGGTYVETMLEQVAVFRLTAAQATQVREMERVIWVGLYHPAYALAFELAGREEPYSATALRDLAVDPAALSPVEDGTLEVAFFDDVDSATMVAAAEAAGATVRTDTGFGLVVDIAAADVPDLLRLEGVCAVEPHFSAEFGNQRAGTIIAAHQVRNFGNVDFLVNLDGTGEIAGVMDSGLDAGPLPAAMHLDLAGRVLQVLNLNGPPNPSADVHLHGTHVTGSIAGNGTQTAAFGAAPPPANPSNIRGVAPASHIVFHSGHQPTVANPMALNFGRFIQGFVTAHNVGARVHSNSWAHIAAVTLNAYTALARQVDRFCHLYPDSLVLFLAHNQERDVAPADGVLDGRSLARQSVAKNILCVGACENQNNRDGDPRSYNAILPGRYAAMGAVAGPPPVAGNFPISDTPNQVALFSNRGRVGGVPVARRRIKPDVVAPGTNIVSTGPAAGLPLPAGNFGRPTTAPPAFYQVHSGTSMATPITAGAAVLTRQFYRARFGQLRRPLLLEHVPALVDLPSMAAHADGAVMAWVRQTAAPQNDIVAARFSRDLTRVGAVATLAANVGDHPAPMVAQHGDNTLLLHRASDNTLRLSLFDRNLAAVAAFGTAGTVTLAPASRPEDDRPPALFVQGDEAAVVWAQTGGDNLVFQRFHPGTGAAIDGAPATLGSVRHTSPHRYVTHNGTHYLVVWVQLDGTDRKLQYRCVDSSGNPVGTQPVTLLTQAQDIRDPHLLWDTRHNRLVVVWAGSNTHAGGDIFSRFFAADGTPQAPTNTVFIVSSAHTVRRPFIAVHRDGGYVLVWEDNTQNANHDVSMTFLDDTGRPNRIPPDASDPPTAAPDPVRLSRRQLRISDTPLNTSGFTAFVDGSAATVVWQSNDEINSNQLGVYAVNVTPEGAFQAQADPNTPLMESGRYVNHSLTQHANVDGDTVAMAWAGGSYFLLRIAPGAGASEVRLVRTNADGLVDTAFGVNGARALSNYLFTPKLALHWWAGGSRLIGASAAFPTDIEVHLMDGDGNPVAGFGTNGTRSINEPDLYLDDMPPQLGHYTRPAFRVVLAYGSLVTGPAAERRIRYAVLNGAGNLVIAPRTLANANGTARQGWFHFVNGEGRSIGAWHRETPAGGPMNIFLRRFRPNGTAPAAEIPLTAQAGDSRNAVIAPRPVNLTSSQREYGLAWQNQPAAGAPWQILFSRLRRDGSVMAAPPAPAPAVPGGTRDVPVVFPGAPGWPAATHAMEPQLVSSFTHESWANPPAPPPPTPQYSPSYGLAWIGQSTGGGDRALYFTALDENGRRLQLTLPPPYAVGAPRTQAAPLVRVSSPGIDVRDFHLIWNGRVFRLTWTEVNGTNIRHMQTSLTRHGSRAVFDQPSAALLRATLINGATNINRTALPNLANGYGWGRVNLRQSLAPSPPVTFHVRDDNTVGVGRTARYRFRLPNGTALLRVTLCWNDLPGPALVNNLGLRVITPAGIRFHGNTWQGAPTPQFSQPVAAGAVFENVHNTEQVVINAPPAGDYQVEVVAQTLPANNLNPFRAQAFSLVFVGSGTEIRFGAAPALPLPVY